ncbi:hypothetical protein R2601_04428 [Salipiger bermudensis HTCC2601]|uniref:Uncharacterized protein n=1 Tax=Salipiger bermudensis (strain DSM 26914 / JCM 13377 / KCTC 12554 / HTCC2601) TaxID=314265 RepID=Q0FVW0_SALBH|nr:hypothetical protein R2601_04428 [Salipiger bermudensis HTCC2601]
MITSAASKFGVSRRRLRSSSRLLR